MGQAVSIENPTPSRKPAKPVEPEPEIDPEEKARRIAEARALRLAAVEQRAQAQTSRIKAKAASKAASKTPPTIPQNRPTLNPNPSSNPNPPNSTPNSPSPPGINADTRKDKAQDGASTATQGALNVLKANAAKKKQTELEKLSRENRAFRELDRSVEGLRWD